MTISVGQEERSAWLRGRMAEAVALWGQHGFPPRIMATLGDDPERCARCGAYASEPLVMEITAEAGILILVGTLCFACDRLEKVSDK